jgi:hypothetical protein
MQYHHDRILKGQLFGRVDAWNVLAVTVFSRAAWMFLRLSSGRRRWAWAASRNESERRRRWAWRPHGTNRNDAQYCFLRNRAKFYWTRLHRHAPLFVQNRFVMYITRCTGTSVLCISIFYVHRAHYFINTTAILLCLRRIDISICHVHNLLHTKVYYVCQVLCI